MGSLEPKNGAQVVRKDFISQLLLISLQIHLLLMLS